ncbi:MarR family transcriptional regulator [Candidatus Stoquefichus massiliensis]|uniref:MarR family transcriptional regulator n=1 Tax=Candidatus Stoquefichus massiliensis TaxID=1470350 RepID=UPI00048702E4|nr:MarR family transcriptional regulator [Candidatus Stoquefichus massiliensis]
MYQELLELFAEQLEKQDQLSKLTESDFLHQYGYSDVHSIDYIGKTKDINVTKLSQCLKMTRGAASKIVKRLSSQGLIEIYMKPDNKKEKYYRLTRKGRKIYKEHEKRHQLWIKRDTEFFKRYSAIEIQYIKEFMKDYNQYLEEQIQMIEK